MSARRIRLPSGARFARVVVLIATLGVAAAACVGGGVTAPTASLSTNTVEDGRKLYQANCVGCHGDAGDRVPVAPLNSATFLDSRGDATLVAVITDGKGVMPAWGKTRGGPLNDAQVREVVAYLSSAANRASPLLLTNAGRAIYTDQCATCHGETGDRVPVAPLNAKAFLDTRSDGQLMDVIARGTGVMPAFGQRPGVVGGLNNEQVHAVAAYLRANVDDAVADRVDRGRTLYVNNCLSCHGEKGERIPDVRLASPDYLTQKGDAALAQVVLNGKGTMPGLLRARNSSFDAEDINALLAYLKTWAGLPAGSNLSGTAQTGATPPPAGGPSAGATPGPSSGAASPPAGSGATPQTAPPPNVAPSGGSGAGGGGPPDLVARGKEVFGTNCVACHGAKGDQQPTAKLSDPSFLQQRGDQALTQSITNGKRGMPSWGSKLNTDDIAAVLVYIKSLAGLSGGAPTGQPGPVMPPAPTPTPDAAATDPTQPVVDETPAIGRELFKANCVMCHGEDGNRVVGVPLLSTYGATVGGRSLSIRIGNGAPDGGMPAWSKARGGPLSIPQIAAIVAYIKDTAGPSPTPSTRSEDGGQEPATNVTLE